jgi:NitT/TauT family transport system permease protein
MLIDLPSKIVLAVVLVAVLMFFAVYSGIKDVNQLLVDSSTHARGWTYDLAERSLYSVRHAWMLGSLKVAVGLSLRVPLLGSLLQRLEVSVTCSNLRRALITQP